MDPIVLNSCTVEHPGTWEQMECIQSGVHTKVSLTWLRVIPGQMYPKILTSSEFFQTWYISSIP